MSSEAKQALRRRIFYISGFDPRGARYYHRLYREEAARQAARIGCRIEVGGRKSVGGGSACWPVEAHWSEGRSVRVDYRFLAWDDIVRQHWDRRPWRLLIKAVSAYRRYVGKGAFARLKRSHRGAFYSGLFPVIFVLLWGFAGVAAAALGAALGNALLSGWVGAAIGASLLGGGAFGLGNTLADRAGLFWLLRIYLFVEQWGSDGCPPLEERIDRFADEIARAQAESPADEVVLVGHSVGAIIATAVAARYVRRGGQAPIPLKLLTLGQCVPLLAFNPSAEQYRADIRKLVSIGSVPWVDVTAKVDPLCFHEEDPALACGAAEKGAGAPRMLPARFFRMFSPSTYRRLRRNKLRLHFQYLMSSELDAEYDFFRITAGPQLL